MRICCRLSGLVLPHFDSASLSPLLVFEAAPWRDLKVQGAKRGRPSGSGAERTLTALLQLDSEQEDRGEENRGVGC